MNRTTSHCPVCGAALSGRQTSACSARCRQSAYRGRRRERDARRDAELARLRALVAPGRDAELGAKWRT